MHYCITNRHTLYGTKSVADCCPDDKPHSGTVRAANYLAVGRAHYSPDPPANAGPVCYTLREPLRNSHWAAHGKAQCHAHRDSNDAPDRHAYTPPVRQRLAWMR